MRPRPKRYDEQPGPALDRSRVLEELGRVGLDMTVMETAPDLVLAEVVRVVSALHDQLRDAGQQVEAPMAEAAKLAAAGKFYERNKETLRKLGYTTCQAFSEGFRHVPDADMHRLGQLR